MRDFLSDLKLIVRGGKSKSKNKKYRKDHNNESKEIVSLAPTINEEDDTPLRTPLVRESSDPPSRTDSVADLLQNMSEEERQKILPNLEKAVEELDLEEKRQRAESINGSKHASRENHVGDSSGINESTRLLHASVFTKNGSVTNTPLSLSSHTSNYNPTAGRISFHLTAEDEQEAFQLLAPPSEDSIDNVETPSVAASTAGYPSISSIADDDYEDIERDNPNMTPPPTIVNTTIADTGAADNLFVEEVGQQTPTRSNFVPIPASPPPLPPNSPPSSPS